MTLRAEPITTLEQAQQMRHIRNDGFMGYSNVRRVITAEEQVVWWNANKNSAYGPIRAWLFYHGNSVVGYGLLSPADTVLTVWVPSAGVHVEARGRGYGKEIVTFLASQGLPLYAQALKSNPAAVRTHIPRFWVKTGEDETYVYFATRNAEDPL